MTPDQRELLITGLGNGTIVPYLGPKVLSDVKNVQTGAPIPATSDELILAMNDGRPMAPKLMYEFPRAAMNVELKRGRSTVTRFLNRTYGEAEYTRGGVHDWLRTISPKYVIDINRDTQLQDSYSGAPHNLVVGIARIGGTPFRYKLYTWDGAAYSAVDTLDMSLPLLFKPMGTPRPEGVYIASDADYVDYITELMGGFAIPPELKDYRMGKRYLLMGLRLNRDTERMVMADIIWGAGEPSGWILLPEPNDKERRFCKKVGLEIIEEDVFDFIGATEHA